MKLSNLFNDVYSRLNISKSDLSVYKKDITTAINDAIRELRVEYIQEGLGHEFSTTEVLYAFIEDIQYPFLKYANLCNKVMEDLPVEYTVLSTTCYDTTNEIKDQTQSFDKGDAAIKGNDKYECVESFTSINTNDLTFDPKDVRNYYRANGLTYNIDDVVYDVESGSYFKVNTGYTNNKDQDADTISELDKLYWKRVGTSHIYASHYRFKFLRSLKIFNDVEFSEALSVNEDKVYVSSGIEQLTITYIPKWGDINDLDADLDLPDYMIPSVKDRAISRLAQKMNVEVQLTQQGQQNNE